MTPKQVSIIRRLKRAMTRIEEIQVGRAAQNKSGDALVVLQAALREAVRTMFPNPERFGCFQSEQLKTFASAKPDDADHICSHILECSPCYEELLPLRREYHGLSRRQCRTVKTSRISVRNRASPTP